jgi:hypothetical protein
MCVNNGILLPESYLRFFFRLTQYNNLSFITDSLLQEQLNT